MADWDDSSYTQDNDDMTPSQRMASIISPDIDTSIGPSTPNHPSVVAQPPVAQPQVAPVTTNATIASNIPQAFSSMSDDTGTNDETPDANSTSGSMPLPASIGQQPASAAQTLANVGPAPQYDTGKLAQMQAQRAADATPLNPNAPQFKPGIGTKIRRGIGAYLSGGLGAAVDANYNAPNRAYGIADAMRQAQLGQDTANIADLDKQNEEQQKNYTGKLNQAKAAISLQKNDQSENDRLAKAGLKKDDDGTIVDDQDSEVYKGKEALNNARQTQQELTSAKAALARAQNDPKSPAYRLAQQRVATAAANAGAAQMRARAYALNASAGNLGVTPEGQQIEGSATSAEGEPIGSKFSSQYTKNQSNVAQFNDVLGATDQIEKTAQALVKAGHKLNDPAVAAAIADPKSTSSQWAQGAFVNSGLSPEQRDYVTNVKAYKENLQALRKSAGGGVSDAQVNRLMEMAPGASTPDIDYLKRQTSQIRQTANRLSEGIPNVKGGHQVNSPSNKNASKPSSGSDSKDPFAQFGGKAR